MNEKKELRRIAQERLAALTDIPQRSVLVRQNLAPFLKTSAGLRIGLMIYVSFRNEVVIEIDAMLRQCRFLAVPLIQNGEIVPVRIESADDLTAGTFGILEPKMPPQPVPLENIDVILVPGLAFDRYGKRLGRGKGFYDRFLKTLKPSTFKIAPAFECQMFDMVPTDANDVPLDAVVTERKAYFIDSTVPHRDNGRH
ncbi:MAG: 5-formyltetrahydrofolate cyclo-ligase [Planctomycetaceae bacterium]|jgi:5-formyltetrahydrofolate cyclo-ligase|nr:5-formyltetrahydrofolate cyclo-ligase [Planctomycetaceae bacterium]